MPTKSNNTGGRGGRRPGAGRKKTAIKEKYENGNPGGRDLTVLDIPDVEGEDMVQRLAYERDFYELVLYLEDHRSEYAHFILTGEG